MGKYQKNIEAARRISVVQYLETYHPGELVRKTDKEYGIEPSIEKTRNMQIQLEQQLASAEEEVKRPFPQATELTEKSKRLAVLEGLLNMNDKDIVTDTEPEQQCQIDNRQRGQEER